MHTHTASRLEAGLAGLLTAATASAAPAMGPTPEHPAPEITLYFSVPLGNADRGSPRPPQIRLGLGEIQVAGNLANPNAGDPIRRREWLRFDLSPRRAEPARDLRLTLGGRMTYDLNRGVFGWRSGRSTPDPTAISFNTSAPLTVGGRKLDGCCRPTRVYVLPSGGLTLRLQKNPERQPMRDQQ